MCTKYSLSLSLSLCVCVCVCVFMYNYACCSSDNLSFLWILEYQQVIVHRCAQVHQLFHLDASIKPTLTG